MTTKTTKPAKPAAVKAPSDIEPRDRADMNDPTKSGAEAVADALKAQ